MVDKGNLVDEVRRISGSACGTHHQNCVQLCTLGKTLGSICYANAYPTSWVTVSNRTGSWFRHTV